MTLHLKGHYALCYANITRLSELAMEMRKTIE